MHKSIPATDPLLTMYVVGFRESQEAPPPRRIETSAACDDERNQKKSTTAAEDPRAWAAIVFGDAPDVVGATRRSERLHWSREAAQREAEEWLETGPIAWQRMGEWMMLGRVGQRIVVVTGVLLPKGDPP